MLRRVLISTEIVYHFNELFEEKPSEIKDFKKKNPENLIYMCKTEGISPK